MSIKLKDMTVEQAMSVVHPCNNIEGCESHKNDCQIKCDAIKAHIVIGRELDKLKRIRQLLSEVLV